MIYGLISVAILLFTFIFHISFYRKFKTKSQDQDESYKTVTDIHEKSTRICNDISTYPLHKIKSKLLIDYYIGTLSVLENLMKSINGLSPQTSSLSSIHTAGLLANDCHHRCQRVESAFKHCLKKGRFSIRDLLSRSGPGYLDKVGCYFCSRPYQASSFDHVTSVVDGKEKSVFSCQVCATELKDKKTATILSFIEGGVPIHWSKYPGYKSDQRYWDINNKDLNYKGRPETFRPKREQPTLRLIDPLD